MKLTRRDLRAFDSMAKALLMEAQELGLTVKVSSNNHAIIKSKNGATTALGRKLHSQGRAAQNARAGVRKVIADHCGSN